MAKEFKDWIDEFVENGANPKNVVKWPEEAGGTRVVTELPQVGEEHTIYELQETSKASYGWIFTLPFPNNSRDIQLVFDTYEQMTTTMNGIKIIEGNTYPVFFVAYIRNTNQMYMLNPVVTDQPHWEFRELPKQDDESGTDYAFKVEYTEDSITYNYTYYILKEFVGNERPVDSGFEYSGITLDDKEVYFGSGKLVYVLTNITYPRWIMLNAGFVGFPGTFTYDKLPDSVELETKCYNLLRFSGTYGFGDTPFGIYNTTNNAYYALNPKTNKYQWYNNLEDRENCYFAQSGDYEGEPPHYTGELEWLYEGSFDDYFESELKAIALTEIPYNDIINRNPPFDSNANLVCAFRPKKGGEVTSYWIYANNEWINVEEIRKFETQEKIISPSENTQEITPDEGYDGLSKVTINALNLQRKIVYPENATQFIISDDGFDGLGEVVVKPVKLQKKTVKPTTYKQFIRPNTALFTGLSEVAVDSVTYDIDSNIRAENIKKDVSILGVNGTYEGKGTDLDSITYFLWQKSNETSWTERPFNKKLLLAPTNDVDGFGYVAFVYIKGAKDISKIQVGQQVEFYVYGKGNTPSYTAEVKEVNNDYFLVQYSGNNIYLKRDTSAAWENYAALLDIPAAQFKTFTENTSGDDFLYDIYGPIKVNVPPQNVLPSTLLVVEPFTPTENYTTSVSISAGPDVVVTVMIPGRSGTPNYVNVKDIINGGGTTVTCGYGPNTAAYSCDIRLSASGEGYPYNISATVTRVGKTFASSGEKCAIIIMKK